MKDKDNKILLITNTFFLKAGNQSLYNTILGLKKNGFNITLVTCARGDEYFSFDEVMDHDIRIINVFLYSERIYSRIKNSFLINKFIKLLKFLFSKKLKPSRIADIDELVVFSNDDNRQWKSIIALIEYVIRVRFVLPKGVQYDVLWGYERMGVIVSHFLRRRIPHRLFITSFQGTVLYPYLGIYSKRKIVREFPLEYFSHKVKADLIIMTDDGTQGDKVLEAFKHNRDNIVFIPNGVQVSNYTQDIDINSKIMNIISKSKYTFVTASRLVVWKRIDRSIVVFKHFLTLEPNSHLIIIGDGPEKQSIEDMIDRYSLRDSITLTGFLDHKRTIQIIKHASMLFSFCDYSNMTNSIQEAAYLNIPVATINDGSTDSILNEENSVKANISQDFAQEIASEIILFFRNPDRKTNSNGNIFTWDERMDRISYEIKKRLP